MTTDHLISIANMPGSKLSHRICVFLAAAALFLILSQLMWHDIISTIQDTELNALVAKFYDNSNFARRNDDGVSPPQTFKPELCGWAPDAKVKRILLISTVRSGTSLTGELLSAEDDDAYFFEPLKGIRKELNFPVPAPESVHKAIQILDGIFNCSSKIINDILRDDTWDFKIVRKLPSLKMDSSVRCAAEKPCPTKHNESFSKALVIKALSLRLLTDVTEWLQAHPDIYVVLLVRDPRAIAFSLQQGENWMSSRNATWLCGKIETNLNGVLHLNPNRYRIMKFEDLVERPDETTKALFEFVGRQRNPATLRYFATHLSPTQTTEEVPEIFGITFKDLNKTKYFSTHFRDPSVNYAWKTGFSTEQIYALERDCGMVLDTLRYERFQPHS